MPQALGLTLWLSVFAGFDRPERDEIARRRRQNGSEHISDRTPGGVRQSNHQLQVSARSTATEQFGPVDHLTFGGTSKIEVLFVTEQRD